MDGEITCIWNLDKAICLSFFIKNIKRFINKHSSDSVEKSCLCYYLMDFRGEKTASLCFVPVALFRAIYLQGNHHILSVWFPITHEVLSSTSLSQRNLILLTGPIPSVLFPFVSFSLGLSPPILCLILFLLQPLPLSFTLSPNVFSVFLSVPCSLYLTNLICSLWTNLKLALHMWCYILSNLFLLLHESNLHNTIKIYNYNFNIYILNILMHF